MKRWVTREADEAAVAAAAAASGLPPWLARILAARGFHTQEAVDRFLKPRLSALADPFELPDMDRAVERIWQSLDEDQLMVVYGDYDVDGITSSALLKRVLEGLGGRVEVFLPHRVDDGYGLGVEPTERCIDDFAPGLIITVDCGTNSLEAVEAARARGVDVIVTDHHEPAERTASPVALVNPKRARAATHHHLAGVGVCFKLCHALVKAGRDRAHPASVALDLRPYLEWVALGTVADMVPLVDENRTFARFGLQCLNEAPSTGLAQLLEVAGARPPYDSYHIGFVLGPRLNAAGRLGTARCALDLLLSQEAAPARELAERLDRDNRERRRIESQTLEEAVEQVEADYDPGRDFALVVARPGWHPGVIGIVASRLVRRYQRPALVIALGEDGVGKGSGRSIEGFSLVEALDESAASLMAHGGHAMAAGLTLHRDHLEVFTRCFKDRAARLLKDRDLRPLLEVDSWIDLAGVGEREVAQLEPFGPFGLGNPRPVLASKNLRLAQAPRIVGDRHLKMQVVAGTEAFDAIAFNWGDRPTPEGPFEAAFHLGINDFRGRRSVQLEIQDIRS